MSHPEGWNVVVTDRVRELTGRAGFTVGPDDRFRYEFSHGYERLEIHHDRGGSLSFAGSLHPDDGLCHAKANVVDSSEGICVHCGRTLM